MEFKKYQHLERFGTTEVEGIEHGECYVFPKIDGTNASVWLGDDGTVQAGSRKRHLTLDQDNAGFYEWVIEQDRFREMLNDNPSLRLFGEWLVPHALKTYRDDAWRKFYVFDVCRDREQAHDRDEKFEYLDYEDYSVLLDYYSIEYIVPICKVVNGSYEKFVKQLPKNDYLIKDGQGSGEGIVIKNYDFRNKYGRQVWAKIVSSEFKEKHTKEHGVTEIKGEVKLEQVIADDFVTKALCEKVYAKIESDGGFTSREIPRLLNTVYYDVVNEDCWNFVKKHKNPVIDFGVLKHYVFMKVKEQIPQLF